MIFTIPDDRYECGEGHQVDHQIPEGWKSRVRAYIKKQSDETRDHLLAYDFDADQSVIVHFGDGSVMLLRNAFAIPDRAAEQVAVFTEHCGPPLVFLQ